jgi:hypothetical protein
MPIYRIVGSPLSFTKKFSYLKLNEKNFNAPVEALPPPPPPKLSNMKYLKFLLYCGPF